jgi:threonine synthase
MLALETALPAKFAETIVEAVGVEPEVPAALRDLAQRPQRVALMDCDARQVADYLRQHAV